MKTHTYLFFYEWKYPFILILLLFVNCAIYLLTTTFLALPTMLLLSYSQHQYISMCTRTTHYPDHHHHSIHISLIRVAILSLVNDGSLSSLWFFWSALCERRIVSLLFIGLMGVDLGWGNWMQNKHQPNWTTAPLHSHIRQRVFEMMVHCCWGWAELKPLNSMLTAELYSGMVFYFRWLWRMIVGGTHAVMRYDD